MMEKEVTKGTSDGNEVSKTEEYEKGKLRFASSKYDTIRISVDETNWKQKKKRERRGRNHVQKDEKQKKEEDQIRMKKVQRRRGKTEEEGCKHCLQKYRKEDDKQKRQGTNTVFAEV